MTYWPVHCIGLCANHSDLCARDRIRLSSFCTGQRAQTMSHS